MKIIKKETNFSFIEEKDWFLGELRLKETVIRKEEEETHYSNGFVLKEISEYYIRLNKKREVCSGQSAHMGIVREMSIQKCMDVMNSVDWSIY